METNPGEALGQCRFCHRPRRYTMVMIEHVSSTHMVQHDKVNLCEFHAPATALVMCTHSGNLIEVFGQDDEQLKDEKVNDAATATGMYDHDDHN